MSACIRQAGQRTPVEAALGRARAHGTLPLVAKPARSAGATGVKCLS
jgi:biotin carboxylase